MNNLSEEEKKAMESVKNMFEGIALENLRKDSKMTIYSLGIADILLFLNVFEKQQKEIEELKYKVREHICIEAHEQVKQLYVTKAKIKEKIKELEEEKNISEGMYIKAFYRIKDLKNIEIAVLESLLEED